jgi:hypothetical protein
MNIGAKIRFFKIRGTDYFLDRKDDELKWNFQENLKVAVYVTQFFHFGLFFFNSSLPKKIYAIGCKFELNCIKKKFEDQIENFNKITFNLPWFVR